MRKSSSIPDETGLEKKSSSQSDGTLNKLMLETYGAEILLNTDFLAIQQQVLILVSQIVQKKQFALEDKFIVENAMALWTGCVLNTTKLFNDFVTWTNPDQASPIKNT